MSIVLLWHCGIDVCCLVLWHLFQPINDINVWYLFDRQTTFDICCCYCCCCVVIGYWWPCWYCRRHALIGAHSKRMTLDIVLMTLTIIVTRGGSDCDNDVLMPVIHDLFTRTRRNSCITCVVKTLNAKGGISTPSGSIIVCSWPRPTPRPFGLCDRGDITVTINDRPADRGKRWLPTCNPWRWRCRQR